MGDPASLEARLRAHGLPVPAAWLAFEAETGAITRCLGAGLPIRRDGRWVAPISRDRDCDVYLAEDGAVFHDLDDDEPLVPLATSAAVYQARHDFWEEARGALGDTLWDPWVEFVSADPALVAALALERVGAASDAICERYRGDGLVACVVHESAFVDRGKVRLYGRELPTLVARVIAVGSLPAARGVGVTVFGWPNQRTADVTRVLADALPDVIVRERNNYLGPLEPSDFVR